MQFSVFDHLLIFFMGHSGSKRQQGAPNLHNSVKIATSRSMLIKFKLLCILSFNIWNFILAPIFSKIPPCFSRVAVVGVGVEFPQKYTFGPVAGFSPASCHPLSFTT